MNIEQEKMIVESLPSLYPLQKFEEDAIEVVLNALPKWTSCSERLPEAEGEYLVTDDSGGIKTVDKDTLLIFDDGTKGWCYSQNPVAWMELPEEWKGELHES